MENQENPEFDEQLIAKIQAKIKALEEENPKLTRAIERLNQGKDINPKLKKALEDVAASVYSADSKVLELQSSVLEKIKKFGMSSEEVLSSQRRDELLAHISHLESQVNHARETLEIIASTKPHANECHQLAEIGLEKISLRAWRK